MTRDPDLYGDDARVRSLLHDTSVWAVVGLSDSQIRPAYGVARVLQSKGKRIVPIHLTARTVHGERGYATLADAVFELGEIDVVDCFVNSTRVGAVVDQAIAIGAKAVWMQREVVDEAAALRAREAGLLVVMDRCPAIEWRRAEMA
jgi:predicted CoA-binding protein